MLNFNRPLGLDPITDYIDSLRPMEADDRHYIIHLDADSQSTLTEYMSDVFHRNRIRRFGGRERYLEYSLDGSLKQLHQVLEDIDSNACNILAPIVWLYKTGRENASVVVAYRTNHWDSLYELSRLCGEREVERSGHFVREPLITPADLSAMQIGQALVMITGGTKFVAYLPDCSEVFPVESAKAPRRLPRSTRRVPVHFDIQEYVKDAKRRKMDEMMKSSVVNQPSDFFSAMAQPSADKPKAEPTFDIDKLIAKIDAKIAELEDEEKSAEQDQPGHYAVTLVSCGNRMGAMRTLRSTMSLSLREAKDIIDDLPFKKIFSSLQEARAFASELIETGGTVTTEGF